MHTMRLLNLRFKKTKMYMLCSDVSNYIYMFWPRKYRRLNFPDSDPILKASAIARPKAKAALLQVEGCSEESSIGGKLSESSKNEFLFASKKYIGLWLRVLSLRLLQKRHRRSAQPRLMGRGQVVKLVYFL